MTSLITDFEKKEKLRKEVRITFAGYLVVFTPFVDIQGNYAVRLYKDDLELMHFHTSNREPDIKTAKDVVNLYNLYINERL